MSEQSNDVFISYRRDASGIVANSLFHLLDQAGVDAFYDIASIGAGRYGDTIVNEIRRRPYFLVVLAPGTLEACSDEDDMLRREIETAIDCGAKIVPLPTPAFDVASIEEALPGRLGRELSAFQVMGLPALSSLKFAVQELVERYLIPTDAPVEAANPTPVEVDRLRGLAVEVPSATDEQLQSQELLEQGNRKRHEGDLEGALADYDEAIRLDPDSALAYRSRGTARQEIDEWDAAEADYEAAIRLEHGGELADGSPGPNRPRAGGESVRRISTGGGFMGTLRSIAEALGLIKNRPQPVGCSLGKVAYREMKRSAQITNVTRPRTELSPATKAMLRELYPDLDVDTIRVRTQCRLPANRFNRTGSMYAMTFGYSIYWRDDLDEDDPKDLVKLIHEVMHVDQVRRLGGEEFFACQYSEGYVTGGGELPAYIEEPGAYHRNPLEAEAYMFESRFRDENGRVAPKRLPGRGQQGP